MSLSLATFQIEQGIMSIQRKSLKFLARLTGPAIFLFLLIKFVDIKAAFKAFLVIRWDWFLLSICFIPLSVFVRSIRWRRILKKHEIDYTLWKCFRLCFIAGAMTSVLSSVGSFVKVFYADLGKEGFAKPFASVLAEKFFDICLPLGLGAAGFALYWFGAGEGVILPAFIAAVFLLYMLIVAVVRLFNFCVGVFIPQSLLIGEKVKNAVSDFQRVIDVETYALSVLEFAIGGFARVFLLIKALGIGCEFLESALIISVNSFVNFIPISYLGIGTRDVGMIGVFKLFGYAGETAIALSTVVLLSKVIFALMGFVFWLFNPNTVRLKVEQASSLL